MNNLLDTYTLIWFITGDSDISNKARKEIETKPGGTFVSIASIWEMAIKICAQKLKLEASFESFIEKIFQNSFQILPVSIDDALVISSLPSHHRDPFDRMIIAQAQNYNLQIITKDSFFKYSFFKYYNVSTFW